MSDRDITDSTDETLDRIESVLKESSEPVLSAQDIADEVGITRQYVHQVLGERPPRRIERVSIGPSVGYYIDSTYLEDIDNEFEGRSVTYPTKTGGMPVICRDCDERLGEGDEAIVLLETSSNQNHNWDLLAGFCEKHAPEIDSLPRETLGDDYFESQIGKYGVLAVVQATLSEETQYYENPGEDLTSIHLRDVAVRSFFRAKKY